jgi:spermidine synthase
MSVLHKDARILLQQAAPADYDVIVGDVFHDIAIPYHLLTREYSALIKSRLVEGGIYTLNIVDIWPDAQLVKSVVKTLAQDFRFVDVWLEQAPVDPTRMTYVISATNKAAMPDTVVARRGFQRRWRRETDRVLGSGVPLDGLPILTDDFVPVERLISPLLLTGIGR